MRKKLSEERKQQLRDQLDAARKKRTSNSVSKTR